jgi:hypothetical protein
VISTPLWYVFSPDTALINLPRERPAGVVGVAPR